MQTNESDSTMPWMTDEIKNQIRQRDKIIENQDIEGLFSLTDNSDFSIALNEILNNKCNYKPDKLNLTERTLFLCMQIENAGQADSILGFLQEDFPEFSKETITALQQIGAIKSATIIKQAVKSLPKDGTWFFETSDEDSEKQMRKLDREFSNYPDGFMRDLYRNYAEKNKHDLI